MVNSYPLTIYSLYVYMQGTYCVCETNDRSCDRESHCNVCLLLVYYYECNNILAEDLHAKRARGHFTHM